MTAGIEVSQKSLEQIVAQSETVLIDTPTPEDIQKQLLNHDSIHTIKEDDFAKEEDETLHEESRDLNHSPNSRKVPTSQLDIPLGKFGGPSSSSLLQVESTSKVGTTSNDGPTPQISPRIVSTRNEQDSPIKLKSMQSV